MMTPSQKLLCNPASSRSTLLPQDYAGISRRHASISIETLLPIPSSRVDGNSGHVTSAMWTVVANT
jgi:hypothetical protein